MRSELLIRKIAEQTHQDFLKTMHKKFRLSPIPKTLNVEVESRRKDLRKGYFQFNSNPPRIYINPSKLEFLGHGDKDQWYDVALTSAHETAHYLHFLVNHRWYSKNTRCKSRYEKTLIEDICEIVAETGALDFFKKRGELELIYKYAQPSVKFYQQIHNAYKSKSVVLSEFLFLRLSDTKSDRLRDAIKYS